MRRWHVYGRLLPFGAKQGTWQTVVLTGWPRPREVPAFDVEGWMLPHLKSFSHLPSHEELAELAPEAFKDLAGG